MAFVALLLVIFSPIWAVAALCLAYALLLCAWFSLCSVVRWVRE